MTCCWLLIFDQAVIEHVLPYRSVGLQTTLGRMRLSQLVYRQVANTATRQWQVAKIFRFYLCKYDKNFFFMSNLLFTAKLITKIQYYHLFRNMY